MTPNSEEKKNETMAASLDLYNAYTVVKYRRNKT